MNRAAIVDRRARGAGRARATTAPASASRSSTRASPRWHDDLGYRASNRQVQVVNGQRVTAFVDFVNGRTTPYDDNGHGTHVAGIIAGNGYDTLRRARRHRAGRAPRQPQGPRRPRRRHISNVIAALDWAVANATTYNIRVINLSVGAAVTESYMTDPLTLAAKRAVDAGIVVVAAAGNLGKNAQRAQPQYGGITAPGNAPWVLTVGAYSHEGTLDAHGRQDRAATARAVRRRSTSSPSRTSSRPARASSRCAIRRSLFYTTKPTYLLNGSLSHDRQAVPEPDRHQHGGAGRHRHGGADAAGEPEPDAEPGQGDPPVHGAGLRLRRADAGRRLPQRARARSSSRGTSQAPQAGSRYPSNVAWSKHDHLGQPALQGGVIKPPGSAWAPNVVWGARGRRRGRQHRVGHGAAARRVRQHRVGHRRGWTPTTSSGARSTATATTSSGAPTTVRRQHRLGHGLRRRRVRQHRLGHRVRRRRLRQHRVGHQRRRRRARQHRVGHADDADGRQHRLGHQRRVDNIVWGTVDATTDNIVWGCSRRRRRRCCDDPDDAVGVRRHADLDDAVRTTAR